MNISIEKRFQIACEQYAEYDVDVEQALRTLETIHLSIPCWQADDVTGLEIQDSINAGGGIMATGNYPGRASNIQEIRMDLSKMLSLIPGKHRINLHAMYGDFQGKKVDRNQIDISHFESWMDWAKSQNIGLDFNPTYFAHPKANSGFTLSSKDSDIRQFWIEHGKRCRDISAKIGEFQKSPCVQNTWIPDGCKDIVMDKRVYRDHLKKSLDDVFSKKYSNEFLKDSVESKLFGLGSESFVSGSYDFYLSYALTRQKMICLDMGHFHPTESITDKLSAILQFSDQVLIHITRSVRWDSDHIPILNQELQDLTHEIVRNQLLNHVILALDFFDASINRIVAYVIGVRAVQQALLTALLEPVILGQEEDAGKNYMPLAKTEFAKTLPSGAVWDYYCEINNVPPAADWIQDVEHYSSQILSKRI